MGASDPANVNAARVTDFLRAWLSGREYSSVELHIRDLDPEDSDEDYQLVRVLTFRPQSLDRAQVEVNIALDGAIGIGFETWGRIAQRLGGVRVRNSIRYVAGHEPQTVSDDYLLEALTLIAAGDVWVKASLLPFLGLVGARAVTVNRVSGAVSSRFVGGIDYLSDASQARLDDVLAYFPW